jgi:putative membrane protein insertion efficiency factor
VTQRIGSAQRTKTAERTKTMDIGSRRETGAMPALSAVSSGWLRDVLIALIKIYQWTLSPLLGACCRFEPSCSRYTLVCIERWGPFRGSWLGLRRLSRCHPFCPGGHDPPPELMS